MINQGQINAGGINASGAAGGGLSVVHGVHTTGLAMPADGVAANSHKTYWPVPVMASHKTVLKSKVVALHVSHYDLLTVVAASHNTTLPLAALDTVERDFSQGLGFAIEQSWTLACGLEVALEKAFTQKLALLTTIERSWGLDCPLPSVDAVERGWVLDLGLTNSAPLVVSSTIGLVVDGQVVELADSSSLGIEEGDYAWKGQLVLANSGDGDKFDYNTALTLSFFGTDYELLVDSKSVARAGVASPRVSIGVVGIGARFAAPRAELQSLSFSAESSARAMVETLLGPVDWRIGDWLIPANRLGADRATPMRTAQRVVKAAGAVLEAKPDGSFYVRYRYPVALAEYATALPDAVIYEADSVVGSDQPYRYFEKANQFRISDIAAANFADRIEYVADEDDRLGGVLRVYPSPWRDVHLRHTGPLAVSLSAEGNSSISVVETVEFIDGRGQAGYPIDSLGDVIWSGDGLGALLYTPGSATLATVADAGGAGLAEVSYTTRAKQWRTASPMGDDVQFLVVDGL
ncbi:MAG: hypothetical protein JKX92_06155 [Porticoccaceae bacterium]|nr:hypothetical protein [Porticoccaceae bacterium]